MAQLFEDQLFFTLIVSLLSTYILYFLVSFLFMDPWHMFTSVRFPLSHPNSESLLKGSTVRAISPPDTNLHQHPQRVRLL